MSNWGSWVRLGCLVEFMIRKWVYDETLKDERMLKDKGVERLRRSTYAIMLLQDNSIVRDSIIAGWGICRLSVETRTYAR